MRGTGLRSVGCIGRLRGDLGHALDDRHVELATAVILLMHRGVGGRPHRVRVPGGARQMTGGQRAERRQAHAELLRDRDEPPLVLAVEQDLVVLQAGEPGPAVLIGERL